LSEEVFVKFWTNFIFIVIRQKFTRRPELRQRLIITSFAASWLIHSQPAHAANFGFVRWPDYLDSYILIATVASGIGFVLLKSVLPSGKSFTDVPKADRTIAMKIIAYPTMLAFFALMAMIFVGMGLQRAAE
jgi:hypothetical protein